MPKVASNYSTINGGYVPKAATDIRNLGVRCGSEAAPGKRVLSVCFFYSTLFHYGNRIAFDTNDYMFLFTIDRVLNRVEVR